MKKLNRKNLATAFQCGGDLFDIANRIAQKHNVELQFANSANIEDIAVALFLHTKNNDGKKYISSASISGVELSQENAAVEKFKVRCETAVHKLLRE